LLRIMAGLLAGWALGLVFAFFSVRNKWVEFLLQPLMIFVKTVPVAAFVVLFLIWFRTSLLAVAISFCVAFPAVYFHTVEGLKSTDKNLLEMAEVFDLHLMDRFFYIYRPALRPFWESSLKVTVGMSWKAGVAAEVIGTPQFSVGEQLYMSKIYLDTAGVLAWTAVIIMASILCEKAGFALWTIFFKWQPECRGIRKQDTDKGNVAKEDIPLKLERVSKSYGENQVIRDLSAEYCKGQCYYFETPSGSGKTTLFRLIAGLENPDEGNIECLTVPAYIFQEDRLCEEYDAVKNVELVTGNKETAYQYLIPLLEQEHLHKPCRALSGGMKRRVAVARAFAAERELVLLDEPFSGLDEQNRQRVNCYIEEKRKNKAVLIASHVRSD